jgi:hypothetical protein
MSADQRDPSEPAIGKRQDTLTSQFGPDSPVRRSSPDIDVVSARPSVEVRLGDVDQRLAACEIRVTGVYERLSKLEKERRRSREQRKRLTRVVFLWVCLVSLFVIVWTFLGPGQR